MAAAPETTGAVERVPVRLRRMARCALLVSVVLAALLLPLAAATGLLLRYVVNGDDELPENLRTPWTAKTTYVYANDGRSLITTFYNENRRDVSLAEIAPVVRQAIVAAEDTRFYQHGGVDPRGVARALVANGQGGGVQQGASTLTMQYVRNVLKEDPNLTPQQRVDLTVDSPVRKLREMRYAVAIDRRLPKPEILRRYLNIAYFGAGAYGIAAASQRYFSKPAGQLTLPEAALLAGLVQSPDATNPISGDLPAALVRRSYVLAAMVKTHVISAEQARDADRAPPGLHPTRPPNDCTGTPAAHPDWGFFCAYFRQWWDSQPAFGATAQDRDNALKEGGYTIVTSLDPGLQAAAMRESLAVYSYTDPRALPLAVVQPGTGRVLAMAVNRHYSLEPNPGGRNSPNTVGQLIAGDSAISGYQAGSTFKMFTMLAALEAGRPLGTVYDAPGALPTRWPARGPGSCDGHWCPANANPAWMDGPRTMWTGFGRSVNTYFVWLEQQLGPGRAIDMARRLGITFRAGQDADLATSRPDTWGAFTLGVASTTPLDLANAYATLAADGVYCPPLPVLSVTSSAGTPVEVGPTCRRAVSPDVARAATDAARCPVGQQSAFGKCDGATAPTVGALFGPRPVAGKTGSSEHNATETFVGFTPQLAAAGIAANPDSGNDFVGEAVSTKVNDAVAKTLVAGLAGQPPQDFPPPSRTLALGR
jgi:membrane peptidoglycan carboxypeptidase